MNKNVKRVACSALALVSALSLVGCKEEIPDTTKIIIAQRVSSVEHADKILILDGGKIIAQGNHQQSMQTSDVYREIYEAQTKHSADDEEGGEA